MEKVNATANLVKGSVPASGRYVANSYWSEAMKKIACAFQLIMELLPDLILGALEAFLKSRKFYWWIYWTDIRSNIYVS